MTQVVYFACRESDGAVKIGMSGNVIARIAELAADAGCVVSLLATIRGGVPLERSLHEAFRRTRLWVDNVASEWFKPSDELDAFIRDCDPLDAPFDADQRSEFAMRSRREEPQGYDADDSDD